MSVSVSKDSRELSLVVLAAGIGSRYGGLKQMDPVGPGGEFLLDYSVFDALRAGFGRIVFVIRRAIEADFRATLGRRIERYADVRYAYQELDGLPSGYALPADRQKPWGTGHAVLVAEPEVREPFGVINADDFYGAAAYRPLCEFLRGTAQDPKRYAMVAFELGKTLSEHGTVSRGICTVNAAGDLTGIREVGGISAGRDGRTAGPQALEARTPVSMNMWGFKPSLFAALRAGFAEFLQTRGGDPKAEYYLPAAVDGMIASGAARVRVFTAGCAWFGMTNHADRARVVAEIARQVHAGGYPERLWE